MSPTNAKQPDDLTRKERREQARAQRRAVEEAQRASATRRRRLFQLGGLAALVVVIIVVIVVATSGGGGSSKVDLTGHQANATVTQVSTLLDGIPQEGNRLGDPNAPVTLQYFGDLECPICRNFTVNALPTIINEFVRPGKLKIEYHNLSTATGNAERDGSEAEGTFNRQQIAAMAAGKQNKLWNFVELFYHQQGAEDSGYVNEAFIQGIAQQVPGLNLTDWTAARNDPNFIASVTNDLKVADENHFEGTPSFLLGKTGTTLTPFNPGSGLYEASAYAEAIKKYLS